MVCLFFLASFFLCFLVVLLPVCIFISPSLFPSPDQLKEDLLALFLSLHQFHRKQESGIWRDDKLRGYIIRQTILISEFKRFHYWESAQWNCNNDYLARKFALQNNRKKKTFRLVYTQKKGEKDHWDNLLSITYRDIHNDW